MGKKGSVKLDDLPLESDDEAQASDLEVLNTILTTNKKNPQEYATLKFVLYATMIFALFSMPITDRVLQLAVPMANSWLVLLGLKTIVFFVIYYIIFYVNKQK
jgi:glucan phosphoethanolaminetransferase (alkaline phosphatase superfamily)